MQVGFGGLALEKKNRKEVEPTGDGWEIVLLIAGGNSQRKGQLERPWQGVANGAVEGSYFMSDDQHREAA
jgi:hypothetical protein